MSRIAALPAATYDILSCLCAQAGVGGIQGSSAEWPPRLGHTSTLPLRTTQCRYTHPVCLARRRKTYRGSVTALREVQVDIGKGEFVFLVGPSGSGKSTFLRLLLRQERPDAGRVLVAGRDLNRLAPWKIPYVRRNIGCVFQDFKLLPNKNVYENVAFALEVIGRPKHVIEAQVPQVLDLVGLAKKADNRPDELSGGEQQRVSIARAFVNRPLILLADDPTGNLDPATSVGIMRLLDRINRTGTTIVMATHDEGIVNAMRRRVVELDRGSVVRDQERGVYGLGS